MDNTRDDLFRSVEKSPSYWTQVALLEFLQSLDAMYASKGIVSRKEFANLVGVSPPTLSRWLNGNENLTVSTMCRLATALGAAVHIHVADSTKKGRWKEEPAKARTESPVGDKLAPVVNISERRASTVELDSVIGATAKENTIRGEMPTPRLVNHG